MTVVPQDQKHTPATFTPVSEKMDRTEKKPYKSTCSPLYVDAPNYISELVCQKWALRNDIGALPQYFWRMFKFRQKYQMEVSQARNLLKDFDAQAIINALDSPRAKFITSLRNKKLLPIIRFEQTKIRKTEFIPTEDRDITDAISRPSFGKKNPLRDL